MGRCCHTEVFSWSFDALWFIKCYLFLRIYFMFSVIITIYICSMSVMLLVFHLLFIVISNYCHFNTCIT